MNGIDGFRAGAVSDLPAAEDLLGFGPLVEGLRALLNVRATRLPLAIAIAGPWGAGKSSLMLQLRELLRNPGLRQPQERRWWTVSFPAWKYEHGEHLWAALAKAVYEQPQEEMDRWQRVRFRVAVERERLGWLPFLLKGAGPPLAAGAAVAAAMAANLEPAGAGPLLTGTSSLLVFAGTAARYWGVASMPFKRAMERYASAPNYDDKLGFTSDADRDIRSLARVLAPDTDEDPQALAVFVDDLDRCTSPHVVEVVEAMNQIFNSERRHGCVFILGLDREVVVANIEVAYGPTVDSLRMAGRQVGEQFGTNFLAKLVQLLVTVPRPDDAAVERLVASIAGGSDDPRAAVPIGADDLARVEEEIRRAAPVGLAEVSSASSAIDGPAEAVDLGKRTVRAERIKDAREVIAAERAVLPLLGCNPRRIKRFDNAFRLQLYVANQDRNRRFDFTLDGLIALARWVALRLRWPELAAAIDVEPYLLGALESKANQTTDTSIPVEELDRLLEVHGPWFADRAVREFLRDGVGARRISSLEPGSFLQIV